MAVIRHIILPRPDTPKKHKNRATAYLAGERFYFMQVLALLPDAYSSFSPAWRRFMQGLPMVVHSSKSSRVHTVQETVVASTSS